MIFSPFATAVAKVIVATVAVVFANVFLIDNVTFVNIAVAVSIAAGALLSLLLMLLLLLACWCDRSCYYC